MLQQVGLALLVCAGLVLSAPFLNAEEVPSGGEAKPAGEKDPKENSKEETAEKPAEKDKPGGKAPAPSPAKKTQSDPEAVKAFQKAVSWQGKPEIGSVKDFSVDKLLFKAYGKNEIEGTFRILHKAPDKIYFKVSTPSWWRAYRSDGDAFSWLTGAMSRGWEKIGKVKDEDREKRALINEALRVVRLLFLQNFNDGKTVFLYLGRQTFMRGKKEMGPAHLVKCLRSGEDSILFYLGLRGGMPLCLVVHKFLNISPHPDRSFFIHLDRYRPINHVMLPTRIKVFIRHLSRGKDEKLLFCELVQDRANTIRINQGLSSSLFRKKK